MWPKLKKWLWRFTIIGLILGIIAIILITFFWTSLQKPSYQEYYAQKVIEQLPEPWKSNAECGKIGGRLPGSFLLHDLKISTPNGDQFELYNIEFFWDWSELINRNIVIHTIGIEKVSVVLIQDQNKTWLPDLLSSKEEDKAIDEPKSNTPFQIPEIQFKLQTLALKDIQINLNSQEESWNSIQYHLKELTLNAELENEDEQLSAALNFNSSMDFQLDHYPNLSIDTSLQLKQHHDNFELAMNSCKLSTSKSSLDFQSLITLKKFNPQNISINNLLKNLEFSATLDNSKIHKDDIKLFSGNIEVPDHLKLSGDLNLKNNELTSQWNFECDRQRLQLKANIPQLNINAPLENTVVLSNEFSIDPQPWVPELSGSIQTNLNFSGVIANISTWKLDQALVSQMNYNGVMLPILEHKLSISESSIHLNQTLKSNHLQIQQNITSSLSQFQDAFSIQPMEMPLNYSLNVNINELSELSQHYKNLYDLPLDLAGHAQLQAEIKGNVEQLDYQIQMQTENLYVDQAYPNQIHLSLKGNEQPQKVIDALDTPPSLPEIKLTKASLPRDFKEIGTYLNYWVELIELPNLNLKTSGNELHDLIEHAQVSLTQNDAKKVNLSFSCGNNLTQPLAQFTSVANFKPDSTIFEITEFNINSQLANDWDHPWLQQALNLEQSSRLSILWKQAEINWTPFILGKDKWFQTQGQFKADGNLNATLNIQTPQFETWLNTLPIDLPLNLNGRGFITSAIKGSWDRPMAQTKVWTEGLALEKKGLPKLTIPTLEANINLDTINQQNIELNFQFIPENEKGFKGQLRQAFHYQNENDTLPLLKDHLNFEMQSIEGNSMSLKPFDIFLPENINQVNGHWGLNLKGQLPITNPLNADFNGNFHLDHFSANIQELPNLFKQANIAIKLTPNKIEFEKCRIEQEEGSIDLNGFAAAENLMSWHNPKWDMTLTQSKWQTKALDFIKFTSQTQLNMSGNLHQHHIDGKVEIEDLTLNPKNLPISSSLAARDPNIEMVSSIKSWEEYDNKVDEEKKEEMPNILKTAKINCEVILKHNNWIRDDMFYGELAGKLLVQKDFKQENLHPVGTIYLQKSTLKFQGNRFDMDQGELNWQGDIIPAIDFAFITKVDPYEIQLILKDDQADKVKPEFSSRPWLDNSDIISVLLMGRPLHAESENSGNDSFAQDLAVSQGVSQLSKEMGLGNMGIDVDNVSSKGGTVRVGRYLHPRVYVAIAQTVGDEESNELSLEYLILKSLKLKLTQETQVPMGIDLEWTKDY